MNPLDYKQLLTRIENEDRESSDYFNVDSPRDKAVVYSDTRNHGAAFKEQFDNAQEYERHNLGFTTLETTRGGQWLRGQDLSHLKPGEEELLWKAASKKYADKAEGKVVCVVYGSHPESAFRTVELPVLLDNKKVTHLNGISREKLSEDYRKHGEEYAFQKVQAATQSLNWGKGNKPPGGEGGGGPVGSDGSDGSFKTLYSDIPRYAKTSSGETIQYRATVLKDERTGAVTVIARPGENCTDEQLRDAAGNITSELKEKVPENRLNYVEQYKDGSAKTVDHKVTAGGEIQRRETQLPAEAATRERAQQEQVKLAEQRQQYEERVTRQQEAQVEALRHAAEQRQQEERQRQDQQNQQKQGHSYSP